MMEKESYTLMGSFRPIHTGSEVYLGWGFCKEWEKKFSNQDGTPEKFPVQANYLFRVSSYWLKGRSMRNTASEVVRLFRKAGTRDPR